MRALPATFSQSYYNRASLRPGDFFTASDRRAYPPLGGGEKCPWKSRKNTEREERFFSFRDFRGHSFYYFFVVLVFGCGQAALCLGDNASVSGDSTSFPPTKRYARGRQFFGLFDTPLPQQGDTPTCSWSKVNLFYQESIYKTYRYIKFRLLTVFRHVQAVIPPVKTDEYHSRSTGIVRFSRGYRLRTNSPWTGPHSQLVTVIATPKLGKKTSKLICSGVNQSAICPSPGQEQESQGMVSGG